MRFGTVTSFVTLAVVVLMAVGCAGESEEEVYLTEVAGWYKENISKFQMKTFYWNDPTLEEEIAGEKELKGLVEELASIDPHPNITLTIKFSLKP